MNRPKLKLFGGIALLAVLCVVYGLFLLYTNTAVNGAYNMNMQAAKMRAIYSSVGCISSLNACVETAELEKFTNKVALTSVAAKGMTDNNWDRKSTEYNNGVIVTVSDGSVHYPDGYPKEQVIDAEALSGISGVVSVPLGENRETGAPEDCYLVAYRKIGSDVYYLEGELVSVLEEQARRSFDAEGRMKGIEEALGIHVLIVSMDENSDGRHALLYRTDALPTDFSTAEECGITKEMLDGAPDGREPMTVEKLIESSGVISLNGSYYQTFIQTADSSDIPGAGSYLVYLVPEDEFITMTTEQTAIVLAAFVIVGIILLVWAFSLIRLVRHYRINEEQAQQLSFKQSVRKAFSLIAIGCVAVFILAALFISLFRLFGVTSSVKKSLSVLEQRVEESKVQEKTTIDEMKSTYLSYAERIAGILKERPELQTKEDLQTFSDLIEADYIMIYDHDGKEVVSNSDYIDMELGSTPESSTYEFRRLLKGIPSVVHDAKTDEETGLTNAMFGVRLDTAGEEEKYGALLIAVPEKVLRPENLETMNEVMRSLVAFGTIAFSLNPDNQTIVNSSNTKMIGRNAVSLELPEAAVTDSYRDFFTINDVSCYGESKNIDGLIYYYAAEQPHIYKNVLLYSLIAAASAFAFLAVLAAYLMFGYKRGFDYWSHEGEELIERIDEGDDLDMGSELEDDPRLRWKLSLSKYGLNTPMHNASVTLEILLFIAIVGGGAWYFLKRDGKSGSLINFVLHGQWTKGMNLFSFTSILILFAGVLITVSILKILVRIVTSAMGPKGETFCRLALNLLTYAGVIFFVFMSLYNLGINLGALIASLSLPAFALSLGAKDLITDIVAGISIVFDGEFKVGDIVDISGYRGTVLEIGVRTTKLQGSGNNIKIISNRDIKNVINMSRKTSYYIVTVTIRTDKYKLSEVEDMLKEELPKLEGKIPGVIKGPLYGGVSAIADGGSTALSFSAECEEANYFRVKKGMNHALMELFEEKGIEI